MRRAPFPTSRLVPALALVLVLPLAQASPSQAATVQPQAPSSTTPKAPGNFTGYGFDACVAPSQKVMDAWNLTSPYSAVGIYVSGNSRYCGDKYQPNLSKSWVQKNAANGWRFMPIHVGYQAPCFKNNPKSRVQKKRMSTTVSKARAQGKADAAENVAALKKYGFGPGSVTYLDIEWYPRTNTSCNTAVLNFMDEWTQQIHAAGYKSGVYSSASAAIKSLDKARTLSWFDDPDHVWLAWTNKLADTDGGPYLADDGWKNHQRIHQYHNGVTVKHGGHAVNIDKNWLDVGTGSKAGKDPQPCSVPMTFTSYPRLSVGSRGPAVAALECLLKQQGLQTTVDQTFGSDTRKNVDAFRKRLGWSAKGRTTANTWTALLAAGSSPRVLKRGSTGSHVWRLQRALTAAGVSTSRSGVYDARTDRAVLAYRKAAGLAAYPTAESSVWSKLRAGRIG